MTGTRLTIGLNAVIVAVTEEVPRILTVEREEDGEVLPALPFGPLDPDGDRTLELGLRGWVHEQTGVDLGYVEQLYTFGDRFRDPSEREGGPRVISAAYLALVRRRPDDERAAARWRSVYSFLPWEDRRANPPWMIDETIRPAVRRWVDEGGEATGLRRERASLAFGFGSSPWDGERVLERYEILYEIGLVAERRRETTGAETTPPEAGADCGLEMAFDHRRILATALGRIRAKIRYRPVIFELMPEYFTLLQLQRAAEALAGVRLHKQNFRRLVDRGGLVEGTGRREQQTGGRPAELFRFRREVLLERPAPGVGLPGRG